MQTAQLPLNEDVRLEDLLSYKILGTPAEKEFDELTELASFIIGSPMALITFVDDKRQWFKSRKGLIETETSRDVAFCAHTILQSEVMVVEDAAKDERFFDNPLVTGDLNIRFYAGAPIVSSDGNNLGTICVLDHQPRTLSPQQSRALTILSHQVTRLLELRVKNKIIRRRAEELLQIEKDTLQTTLVEHETDRQFIGTELHENLAQALSVIQLYLEMAIETEDVRLPFLQKSREQVARILKQARELSHYVTPTTLKNSNLLWLISQYIQQLSAQVPYKIALNCEGEMEEVKNDLSLCLFRVMENQLRILRNRPGVQQVQVQIKSGKELTLNIKDDGNAIDNQVLEKDVTINTIRCRVQLLRGTVRVEKGENKGNELVVTLPVEQG